MIVADFRIISLVLYFWSVFMPELPDNTALLSLSHIALGWIAVLYIIATIFLLVIYLLAYFKEIKS